MRKMNMKNIHRVLIILIFTWPAGLTAQTSDTWDFHYPGDNFSKVSPIDLRYLNEGYAGQHGFIRLSPDGDSFVRGDNVPLRFWAVNFDAVMYQASDSALAYCARFLAKMGVNMVRMHCSLMPCRKDSRITDVDTAEARTIWRFVAFMKKEGIYTTISPFWAHNGFSGGWVPPSWNLNGYKETDDLWGLMYFNDTLEHAYKQWIKFLYTKTNPYTGIALKDDPAVGIIQIKNEDGLFFWTMQVMKPGLKDLVSAKFSEWLAAKYGSLTAALLTWNNYSLPGDDLDSNRLELLTTYDMTINQTGNRALRLKDQVAFYVDIQRGFYKRIYDYYRNDLGCRQLINGNNWKTADDVLLNDLERYTNTVCDVMAVNRYFGNAHTGPNCTWRIEPGQNYFSESVMNNPEKLPINIKQVRSKPFIVSESSWLFPNKYETEAPFMIAAYQSLAGIDGYYWFCISDATYENQYFENPVESEFWYNIVHTGTNSFDDAGTRLKNDLYPMRHFSASTPCTIGMFPANALIYRMAYIKESKPLLNESRTMESLLNRKQPAIFEEGYDSNRDQDHFKPDTSDNKSLSKLLYLAGKVETEYGTSVDRIQISPIASELIDEKHKIIRSASGELTWDYAKGICMVNSDKAQGVCGFLNKTGRFDLQAVTIRSQNEFAAISVVSLDSLPIASSKKIFVQAGTIFMPADWAEKQTTFEYNNYQINGYQIINSGQMPWKAQNTVVTIEIKNKGLSKATILDEGGYFREQVKTRVKKGRLSVELPVNTMYMIIE